MLGNALSDSQHDAYQEGYDDGGPLLIPVLSPSPHCRPSNLPLLPVPLPLALELIAYAQVVVVTSAMVEAESRRALLPSPLITPQPLAVLVPLVLSPQMSIKHVSVQQLSRDGPNRQPRIQHPSHIV